MIYFISFICGSEALSAPALSNPNIAKRNSWSSAVHFTLYVCVCVHTFYCLCMCVVFGGLIKT